MSLRALKRIRRLKNKLKTSAKRLLKSNQFTHSLCRNAKTVVQNLRNPLPKLSCTKDIIDIMCPPEDWNRQRADIFEKDITFSILVPLYNTPEKYLREMLESVQFQSYPKWELCLADGSDDRHSEVQKICEAYAREDSRIKYRKLQENQGISENTNCCLEMATGQYIALFDHDDFLHPSALYENMKVICRTDADFLYSDEAIFQGDNVFNVVTKHYKPDFAIDNLRANNYICHFSVFKRTLIDEAGWFRKEFDGSQDHDLILRLTDKAKVIRHIPKIIYYWRSHSGSVAGNIDTKNYAVDAAKRAIKEHLEKNGLSAEVESTEAFSTMFRIKYELKKKQKVSILVNATNDAESIITSVIETSSYDNYELIVSVNSELLVFLQDKYKNYPRIKFIDNNDEKNIAKAKNQLASYADGYYLIFLTEHARIISRNWIEELIMYGQRKDVGVVGGKIYDRFENILHAGIALGIGENVVEYVHEGFDKADTGYMFKLCYSQNVSAVSGDCMLVRAALFQELGGFDINYSQVFEDVDFCVKAREKGYLNIFTPFCEITDTHRECKKHQYNENDSLKLKKACSGLINNGDPYYNTDLPEDKNRY